MDKGIASLAVALIIMGSVILFTVLGTLFGAIGGWIVGWFFGETLLAIFAGTFLKGFSMWQIGAFFGFIGGYFRHSQYTHKEKE